MKGLVVFLCVINFVCADEYFYNLKGWVQPVFHQLHNRALYGMKKSPRLWTILHVDRTDFEQLDLEIREKIAQHLQQEFGLILDKMQQLIDIVKSFALDMINNFHVAVNSLGNPETVGDVYISETVGDVYISELISRAKEAIQQIENNLQYRVNEDIADHFSGEAFHSLAVRIGSEMLKGAEFVNMEANVLSQIEEVLNAVFSDRDDQIETGIMEDLRDTLFKLQPSIKKSQEDMFGRWMRELIRNAVAGAEPQLRLLHGYSKQVIRGGCNLLRKVEENAYQYFFQHRNSMGSSWKRIQNVIELMYNEETT